MPLINIDVYETFPEKKVSNLLDAIHKAVLDSFDVPERDRYQILRKHKSNEMIIQDTGLGFERGDEVVVLTIFSRKRSSESKKKLYEFLIANLNQACQIASKDIMVSIIENEDADWSFGGGRAQFLTGEL